MSLNNKKKTKSHTKVKREEEKNDCGATNNVAS